MFVPTRICTQDLTVSPIIRLKNRVLARLQHCWLLILRSSRGGDPDGLASETALQGDSHRFEQHTRIDTAKPEGIAKDVTKSFFAWFVGHHIEIASRIQRFKI